MITLNADAQQLFDRYLQTVRWSVRGVADPNEIERDVREHVDSALANYDAPVTAQTLREVLSRLGDPWQWIPMEELPWWRRMLMRFSLGPEDWRLAYLCFAMTVVGLVLLPIGGWALLIGSFFLARATYELASDRDGTLGPRRWLIYPPLVLFSLWVLFVLLIGPAGPITAWGVGEHGFDRIASYRGFEMGDGITRTLFPIGAAAMIFGVWWILLSGIAAIALPLLRKLVVPFAKGVRRIHMLWLTGLGVLTAGVGSAVLWLR